MKTIRNGLLIKQNLKERPNRLTSNGYMAKWAICPVSEWVTEWVCDIYVIKEKLSFKK